MRKINNMKIGEHIKDKSEVEWVVSKIWDWKDWIDYELINCETGRMGAKRELKLPPKKLIRL